MAADGPYSGVFRPLIGRIVRYRIKENNTVMRYPYRVRPFNVQHSIHDCVFSQIEFKDRFIHLGNNKPIFRLLNNL